MTRPVGDARRIWTAPILIGVVTLVALIGALVEDNHWDWVAAAALFVVLAYATGLGLRTAGERDARKS